MNSAIAFIFPGQGSQSLGMLADLGSAHPVVKETFDEASGGAGVDLWSLAQQGPVEDLNRTEFTQPALLAASVAVWRAWQAAGGATPALLAGHSLGEYSALVAAGALSLADAAGLVRARGQLMQAAVPEGVGAMAAILAADDAVIAECCAEAAQGEVVAPANFNSPGQTVIAGNATAVDRAIAKLAERGVKKAVRLPVSVPSHTALMRGAAGMLAERIAALRWSAPSIPIVQNADATVHLDLAAIQDGLVRQLYSPVRWSECVLELKRRGAMHLVECGPGKVLAGLAKRIDKELDARAIGTTAEFDAARTALA